MLERAVAIDPEFASAHAELAYACVLRLFIFTPQEKQWEEKAFVAIEKALSRDPDLPEAHVARGRLLWTPVNRFPHEKAIEEYRRALAVNPNLDEAHHQLALVYIHIGLLEKAQHEAETAVALNPSNIAARYRIGESLLFQGKYNEALAVFERTTSGYNPGVRGYQTAWALFQLGRRQEAAAMLEEFLSDYPEDTGGVFAGMQAIFSAAVGDARRAEEKVRQAAAKRAFGHFHHTAYSLASAYALLNKPQAAVQWLQEAVDTGFACYPVFERDPNLDHIRGNLQFIALMTRLKQEWEHRTAAL
jgi:adenylate cyclase